MAGRRSKACLLAEKKGGGVHQSFSRRRAGLTDNPLAARQETYQVSVEASSRVNPGIQMNGSCSGRGFVRYPMDLASGENRVIVVLPQGIFSQSVSTAKPTEGLISSGISINFLIPCKFLPTEFKNSEVCTKLATGLNTLTPYTGPLAVCRTNPNASAPCNPADPTGFFQWNAPSSQVPLKAFPPVGDKPQGKATLSHYSGGTIGPGPFSVYYVKPGAKPTDPAQYTAVENSDFLINGMGGVYMLTIGLADSVLVDEAVSNVQAFHTLSPPNYMSIVWQIPQYVLMAVAEIMFAITGLEFVYTQSAPPLKAFSMAFWMANIGLGDFIGMFIQMHNPFVNMAYEFFAFALAIFLIILLMTFMSLSYPYANYTGIEEETEPLIAVPPELGVDNEGFVNTLVTRL
uniref:PKD_channel domain-containing protein n=1 Tax=Bursaphelenchus xylophilus TaxID=6326 RepID=A0A1I7SGG4_BURXY